jgi:hypothetical protein
LGRKLTKGNSFTPGGGGQWLEPNLFRACCWGNTEPAGGKLKKGKGFLKPNFERVPNWSCLAVRFVGSIDAKYPGQLDFSAVNVSFIP